ncbi:MAG: hypothetical protein Q4F80_05120 [bacterium]|nr:hypothetical protein [bacterium]
MENFEFGLSLDELKKRTDKEYLTEKKMLTPDSKEYLELDEGDKKALKHLVRAAYIIEKINTVLDNRKNISFKNWIDTQDSEQAKLTKILYEAQKGICAVDTESNKISLLKGVGELPQKGLYPEDLTVEKFHLILIKMLNEGKIEEVKTILNQRSVVEWDGDELKGVDYVTYFKEDFEEAADELFQASKVSSNKDFDQYLLLQAQALIIPNPMLDAYADKKWATLQDTPLEFTITRENYADEMTETVVENPELKALLDKFEITPTSKDFLGGRVGIVNKKGTEALLKIKEFLPLLASKMPYADEYEQNISPDRESKQTMVDVDLVAVTGDVGAFRGGITLAENLPNNDKLTFKIDGGRRNVYHRQIRVADPIKLQKRLDAILDKEQHKFYLDEADHWFTIGHENAHSLGPNKGTEALGKYTSIIEENKADMGSLAFVDLLTEVGYYTEEQRKQVIVTFIADNFLKSKPNLSQAHRVRSVMQNYFLFNEGAYELTSDNKIHVNIDKVVPAARKMLDTIIKVQMSGDFSVGEKYVNDNFIWTENMEIIANKLKEINKTLNGRVISTLADELLKD